MLTAVAVAVAMLPTLLILAASAVQLIGFQDPITFTSLAAFYVVAVVCVTAAMYLLRPFSRAERPLVGTSAPAAGEILPGEAAQSPGSNSAPATVSPAPGRLPEAGGPHVEAPIVVGSAAANVSAHSGRIGPASIYAASVIGQRHRADGGGREDAFAVASSDGRLGAVAVADGLGTAIDAHAASAIAAETAAEMGSGWATNGNDVPWLQLGWQVVNKVSMELSAPDYVRVRSTALGYRGRPPLYNFKVIDPATTLAMAAFRPDGDGVNVWWIVYGDAAVFRLDDDGWWLRSDDSASGVGHGTAALPGGPEPMRHGTERLVQGQILILATDGFADAVASLPDELGSVIRGAMGQGVSAAKFSTLLDFDVPELSDDKTLVVVAP